MLQSHVGNLCMELSSAKKNINFSQFVLHDSELYKYIFFKDCLQK